MASLSVQFEPETDADMAAVQTQTAATASLPSDVQTTGVTIIKSSQDMSLIFSLWSPNDTYDANFLKNYGSIYLLDDIKRVKVVDSSTFIRESMIEVVKTLAEALILVLIVVFIFLQSWRGTLIPMLAIPVSLIGGFGADFLRMWQSLLN